MHNGHHSHIAVAISQVEQSLRDSLTQTGGEASTKEEELRQLRLAVAEADIEVKRLKMELGDCAAATLT